MKYKATYLADNEPVLSHVAIEARILELLADTEMVVVSDVVMQSWDDDVVDTIALGEPTEALGCTRLSESFVAEK